MSAGHSANISAFVCRKRIWQTDISYLVYADSALARTNQRTGAQVRHVFEAERSKLHHQSEGLCW
jgi:hypothetical protein